jgi:nitrate/nitrite transporter NarK
MNKKSQSLRVFLSSGLIGIISMILAIMVLLEDTGKFFERMTVVVTVIFFFTDVSERMKWDRYDELARKHTERAAVMTLSWSLTGLFAAMAVFTMLHISCSSVVLLLFVASFMEICYTVLFIRYERKDMKSDCSESDDPPEESE